MRVLLLCSCLLAASALAQKSEPQRTPAPVQTIDFGKGDLIEGGVAVPLGQVYLAPPHPKFPTLIKVRMNFDDKLRESVHEM